jgi:hypothetical protein
VDQRLSRRTDNAWLRQLTPLNYNPGSYAGRSTNDPLADHLRAQLQICALAKKGAGVHFNLQSVDNCPFFFMRSRLASFD